MAKKSGAKAKSAGVTVATTPLIRAAETVLKDLKDAQKRFDRLTPAQQKKSVNAKSIKELAAKVKAVEALKQSIVAGICCDLQVQNCDYLIEE